MKEESSFRKYLIDRFCAQYQGLDDEMPDAESEWFADLDVEDIIDYAERWHKEILTKIKL